MKIFRYCLWAAIFVLGAFLAYSTVRWTMQKSGTGGSAMRADIGGPFSAVNSNGKPITHADLKGRPHVLFFGFTHCPDVCPTTLYEGSQWLKELGDDGNKVDIYFVTVDPERDTAEVLGDYLSAFDPHIKGITGSIEQIGQMTKNWRVYSEKVPTDDGDYTMNHTATTFLMNSKGEFVRTIAYGEDNKVAIEKLRKLVREEG
ncbi:MAG: redoxin domain-containing protein [Rhizobiaceae bacterium]|nr:redoxin domain-containing protein [Rhizobiaceae bacterium]